LPRFSQCQPRRTSSVHGFPRRIKGSRRDFTLALPDIGRGTTVSLSRELVRLIRKKPAAEADLKLAALMVLDTTACAMGGLGSDPARMLAAMAQPSPGDIGGRAFLFGGLCHILELDDLHRASVTHPGSVVVPAAWAMADHHDLRGRDFLRAILAGYETCTRAGMAAGPRHYKVWHATSTCGPFGAAMAAAELLELNEDACVWALGNAGTQSSGLWEFLPSASMSKHLHTARAAQSGVIAALLAREGFTGPGTIFEGERGFFRGMCPDPRPEAIQARPDAPWEITRDSVKPWPCCRHTHPAIDAALAIHSQIGGKAIGKVSVRTYQVALDICDHALPDNAYAAKFSLQHCVATALSKGVVIRSSFDDDRRLEVRELAGKVQLGVSEPLNAAYPQAWGAEVEVETADGRLLRELRPHCKGDPENPMSEEEIVAKALDLLQDAGLTGVSAESLCEGILRLAEDEPVRGLGLWEHLSSRAP
jgi:2-methylcitrate dehydratase PrpD